MVGSEEALRPQVDAEPRPEVCEASLVAARGVTRELLTDLGRNNSVMYLAANDRNSRMAPADRLGLVPALLVDPAKSNVVVARYLQQGGELPPDASVNDPDAMLTLWAARKASIPPLLVPEGQDENTMVLSDRLGMRGARYQLEQGIPDPVIFERSEVTEMEVAKDTRVFIAAGARKADLERVESALAIEAAHPSDKPLIASADPLRILKPDEIDYVKEFAPGVTNEYELFVASAVSKGFVPAESNLYGSTYLPDGSTYISMVHKETGKEMIVLAPVRNKTDDGRQQTGVFNTYKTLIKHGSEIKGINGQEPSEDFQFEGGDWLYVTSTHYGTMGVMNNLQATYELRVNVNSFRVVGDNQPARNAQAHLIEIGKTLSALEEATNVPAIRAGLLGK